MFKSTALPPTGLMCELLADPARTQLATTHPCFGWIVNDAAPDAHQSAYQIRVAQNGTCVWDSGKVASPESSCIRHAGPPLAPQSTYAWQVRTWNQRDEPAPWSAPQPFHTGSLHDAPATARYPIEQTSVAPRALINKGAGTWFADFGRAAFATLRLTLDSPRDGHPVTLHLGEKLAAPHTLDRQPPGSIRYRRADLSLRRGRHTYTIAIPPDARNTGPRAILMPPPIGEVLPFRYAELENIPGTLTAAHIHQLAAHYPFNDTAARFTCDNPVIDAVWELCRDSIKATSFCGVYVDGDRERIPYTADAYLNQLGHYGVDREFSMARYSTECCLRQPTWPTEWILHAPLMAWADYLHTGNPDLITRTYHDLVASTLLPLARPDGLISTRTGLVTDTLLRSLHMENSMRPLEDIVDWPPAEFTDGGRGERDDYDMTPVNTVVNAFHYRALVLMSRMAKTIGRDEEATRFSSSAAQVAASINRVLFDESRGVYRDGENSTHCALHANMFPMAFGLAPREQVSRVASFIKSRGMACSVYGAQYLLEALFRADEDAAALDLMSATHDRSWWNMLAVGSTMTLEAWDLKYKKNLDWNHAWGAAPANIIPRYLMGIRPLEPGFGKIVIQPRPGTLRRAEITLPTIRGPVQVRFERGPKGLSLELNLPANMTARIGLPAPNTTDRQITVDGHYRPATPEGRHLWLNAIGSGSHQLRL